MPSPSDGALPFDSERALAAHRASSDVVRRTPVLTSASLSQRCGGVVALKAECLQRTGSFKLRGALAKLRSLGPGCTGVVAGSAGNHGQSLAYAARHCGVPCEIFMPVAAAVSKVAAVEAFGAVVHQEGDSVDACVELARRRAASSPLTLVHPFDDDEVIVGQAGLGVELAQDVGDLRCVVVPVGGGGLASGVAMAVKCLRPEVEVVGVQAAACAPFPESLRAGAALSAQGAATTIADGIAVKRPGDITLPLVERWLDDVVTVDEQEIAEAMVLMLERAKLVTEGAGAASVAALIAGQVSPSAHGTTVAILSGGNIDIGMLAAVAARHETFAGRRARLFTRVPDRPGGLARLLTAVADTQANVIAVEHVRDGVALGVRETGLDLTVETRSAEHLERTLGDLRSAGYDVERLS